jgi:hypothetical protein
LPKRAKKKEIKFCSQNNQNKGEGRRIGSTFQNYKLQTFTLNIWLISGRNVALRGLPRRSFAATWQFRGDTKIQNLATWQFCGDTKIKNLVTWQFRGSNKKLNFATRHENFHYLKILIYLKICSLFLKKIQHCFVSTTCKKNIFHPS